MRKLFCDHPEAYELNLQDQGSPIGISMADFHNTLMYYLIIIFTVVAYILLSRVFTSQPLSVWRGTGRGSISSIKYFTHSTIIELIWTIIPAIILVLIAIPSFKLLYSLEADDLIKPLVTLKVIGYQWFWGYEISDIENLNINFDSYVKSEDDLQEGEFRLLEVDNRVLLPIHTPIRLLITANDVIHSFAVPSLGIKTDAIPGRINHASIYILRPGVYYGQCSELCGASHHQMPIVIEGVTLKDYILWLSSFIEK